MEIYELPPAHFSTAAPVFRDAWADEAFIDAVFEGKQPGRVFVDHPTHPTSALLCRTFEYYVAGDPSPGPLRQFIKDAPEEAGVFGDLYGYVPIGQPWQDALLEDHGNALRVVERRGFKFESDPSHLPQFLDALPEGATIQAIDRALAERIDREMSQLIGIFWQSYDAYERGGFGYCALLDGNVAAVAYAIAVSSRQANIDVESAGAYRRRGLALATCAAFVKGCIERGLTATWDCDAENTASYALAQKLGFTEYPPFVEIGPPRGTKLILSQGIWSRQGQPRTSIVPQPTIWQRGSS